MFVEHRNKKQQQHKCIIYCMYCQSLPIMDKFQFEIRIPNVCKSNLNSNFKMEVRTFELRLTSLILKKSLFTHQYNGKIKLNKAYTQRIPAQGNVWH